MSNEPFISSIIGKDDIVDIYKECELKINELLNSRSIFRNIDIMIVKLIMLLYDSEDNKLNFGEYLNSYKNEILKLILDCFKRLTLPITLENYLSSLKDYGLVFNLCKNSGFTNVEYIYDFFTMFRYESKVKEIINKIFVKKIILRINYNITIKELIESIINSKSIQNGTFDYLRLYNFIQTKYEVEITEKNKEIHQAKNKDIHQAKKSNKKTVKKKSKIKKSIENEEKTKLDDKNENIKEDMKIEIIEKQDNMKDNSINKEHKECINSNWGFINYFKRRKEFYETKNFKTPILNDIIEGKINIDYNLFKFKIISGDFDIEPYNIVLQKIIDFFSDDKNYDNQLLEKGNIGYACYKNKSEYIESIYAVLPNETLFENITNKKALKSDEFYDSKKELMESYFKVRGLALEYFINTTFVEIFKYQQLPRAFFHLKNNVENIKENNEEDKKNIIEVDNKNKIDSNKSLKETQNVCMDEIDGVFYNQKKEVLKLENLPFIEDYKLEIKTDSNKFKFTFSENGNITMLDNSLILIEVKNRFPSSNLDIDKEDKKKEQSIKNKEDKDDKNKEDKSDKKKEKKLIADIKQLEKEFNVLLKKADMFYQVYSERFNDIKYVQILFFYDSVRKKGYEEILQNNLNEFFKKNRAIKPQQIQIEMIFILSSYFAIGVKDLRDKIIHHELIQEEHENYINSLLDSNNSLNKENDNLNIKLDYLTNEIGNLNK